jgi:hypothetical protein
MLGFFRFGSMVATMAGGLALLGAFGGCGPASGTCSSDNHTVLDANNKVSATCTATQACVTQGSSAACVPCDPTQCVKGNSCVPGFQSYDDAVKNGMNATTECRLTCNAPTDCPFNYHCFNPGSGGKAYCAHDRASATYTPTATTGTETAGGAPWGVACSPAHGMTDPITQNSDCDSNQNFWCYGTSPTDGNAFCTQYQCVDDGDCAAGWWCATVNDHPDLNNSKRYDWGSMGTMKVCLPRAYDQSNPGTYCAPCKAESDCPLNHGVAQHCVSADANGGTELMCAAECTNDKNCPLDYHCKDPGSGTAVCVPRAATCMGKGGFCDPCHSDVDCQVNGGYCFHADYSTEHFCTIPTATCTYSSTTGYTDMCPTLPTLAAPPNTTTDGVGCTYNSNPMKQCYAANAFGLGCYTFHCAGPGGSCYKASDCCSNVCNANACN